MTIESEGERFLKAMSALIEKGDGLVEIAGPEHASYEAGLQDYRVTLESKLETPIIATANTLCEAAEAALERLEEVVEEELY